MPMGQHPSLKPASLRSRTLGSTLRLPTPLVSFGRPSLFGAAVANTVAEEERDPVQFALCFHSTLAVMPSAPYPSDPVDALVTER
jgi:hypothetical protein